MNQKQIAIIFDMDGVIIDSNPYHLISWRDYLKSFNIEATDQDLKNHMYGKSNSYILNHFFKKEHSNEEILKKEYDKEKWFRDIFEPHAKAVDGFESFLEDLFKNNAMVGIATSAPVQNLQLTLKKIPITQQIHSKKSSEDVQNHKPHPEVYLATAEKLGVPPERCVVFEDSFSGVTAGLNAGMKVVGVLTSYTPDELPPCHAHIKDFSKIDYKFCQELINV